MASSLPAVDCRSWDVGRVDAYVELVQRGVRPAAEVIIPLDRVPEVSVMVNSASLRAHVTRLSDTHASVYIYKHWHLLPVILYLQALDPGTVFHAWCMGKLFGYSEMAIESFITQESTIVWKQQEARRVNMQKDNTLNTEFKVALPMDEGILPSQAGLHAAMRKLTVAHCPAGPGKKYDGLPPCIRCPLVPICHELWKTETNK